MIYVDISAAVHSRAGLGRYSQSLARELLAIDPDRYSLFYNRGSDGKVPPSLADSRRRSISLSYKPWRMAVLLAQWSRFSFNRLVPDAELFHSTEHLLMPLRGVPTVLTVHDLIFKRYPQYHKRLNYLYLNLALPLFCRRADAIVAVSESTRDDLVDFYQIEPSKITVIPEAAADHFRPPSIEDMGRARRKYDLPEQYLLHISTIEPRKNLPRLLKALRMLRGEFPRLNLVLVGARGWLVDDMLRELQESDLADAVHLLGWVPDDDMAAVIGSAALGVQPSLYEGFGLPLLEHMASGQVVAASNSSSHPEVGGDAAAYFKAEDVEGMSSTIARLLKDEAEYQSRRESGLKQAAGFSWRETARQTAHLYERLLSR